jgi:thiol-disulfide isomerase/thioredoxin/tetratricopeptide (TPR) repeat protein
MKPAFSALLLLLFIFAPAVAQKTTNRAAFAPSKPKVGDKIAVTYNASGTPLAKASAVMLDVLVYPGNPSPDFKEIPMTKSGSKWKASITVGDKKTALLAFRFTSGDSIDDDHDNVWAQMIFDKSGKPVEGAHLGAAMLYYYGVRSFKRAHDLDLENNELEAELLAHPDNWDAATTLWDALLTKDTGDSLKTALRAKLDKFSETNSGNDSLLAQYPAWYDRLGDSAKAKEIRTSGAARMPQGRVAFEARMSQIGLEKDAAKRVDLAKSVLTDFPHLDSTSLRRVTLTMLNSARAAGNADVIVSALGKLTDPAWYNYMQAGSKLVALGVHLEEAESFAKKAVDMTATPDPKDRGDYKTNKDWRADATGSWVTSLDIYARALAKNGKGAEAELNFSLAYDSSKGEDSELDQRFLQTLAQNKKYQKAVDLGSDIVVKGKSTDSLMVDMKHAYALNAGAASFDSLPAEKKTSFDDIVAKAHAAMVEAMRKKVLASRISEPSVDFTLNDLDGKPVHLADFKGKVIIVDFWATWCGPCKSSFPFFQKVYDKYKSNPKVAFFALNSWEHEKDYAATVDNAKKFRDDHKYTFPILVDGKNEVIDKYQVDGIPTKFIIDPSEKISFKSIGYDGPDMEEEMTQQIEVLLAEASSTGMN